MGHTSLSVTSIYSHAIGNIDNVELYKNPSSEMTMKEELPSSLKSKKPKSFIKTVLGNANLKTGYHTKNQKVS
jgi:hypothetical protein